MTSTEPLLAAHRLRALLRKLRDLNLRGARVALAPDRWVAFGGCLSLDGPAEAGVRYRMLHADGAEETLELALAGERLEVRLGERSALVLALSCDAAGRALARSIGARVSPESCDPLQLERFLRRVLRATSRSATSRPAGRASNNT